MTNQYSLLAYYVHSCLESVRKELTVTVGTTVENFREAPKNKHYCDLIFKHSLSRWNYELSNNQMCNGINLFLKCYFSQN
jgi:hypothetical protein